jgi:hypothetical protein
MTPKTTEAKRRGRPRTIRPASTRARKPENMADVDLLARAIAMTTDGETGAPITDIAFADKYLKCNPRTLRKYRGGRNLPPLARVLCEKIVRGESVEP